MPIRPTPVKEGYGPPASELPGAKTLVTPKSEKNLPNDIDREKERALPPGSATPNSPKKQDGDKDKNTDRSFQDTSFNTDVKVMDKFRTKSEPGEQHGNPSKNDYNMPTRRVWSSYTLFEFLYDTGDEEGKTAGLKTRFPKKRQRRQRGRSRMKSKRWYRRNRARHKLKAKRRYQRLKRRPNFKRDRQMRRKYPNRFKRRRGEVLTAPEIRFVIGRDQVSGVVHGVSPMTAMVSFVTEDGRWVALPIMYFMSSVAFISEADIEAMFQLIDVEVGLEAYGEIGPEAVEGEAELFCVDWEGNAEFRDKCEKLTGKMTLDEMTSEQLEVVSDALVSGDFGGIGEILEGGGRERDYDDQPDDKGDPYEIDPADDRLYYGEVEDEDALAEAAGVSPRRLASRYLREFRADELILYDQENLKNPSEDESPYTPSRVRYKDRPKGNPPANDIPEAQTSGNPPSHRVTPGGQGGFVQYDSVSEMKTGAAKMMDLSSKTISDVHGRSKGLPVRLVRANPEGGIWLFDVKGSRSTYRVRIKGVQKGNVRNLRSADVKVSCSCPFWRWQGPEHWGKVNGYLYGRPRGTASVPVIRDPQEEHWACKHVLACIRQAERYFFMRKSSEEDRQSLYELSEILQHADSFEVEALEESLSGVEEDWVECPKETE